MGKSEGVSIIFTAHNGARHVREQLRSIVAQLAADDELIVGDDGSTDDTPSIIEDELSRCPASLVRFERTTSPLGLNANIERCVREASRETLLFADHDDVWLPGKVAYLRNAFVNQADTAVVFSDARIIDESGVEAGYALWEAVGFTRRRRERWRTDPLGVLMSGTVVTGAAMAMRRSAALEAMPIPAAAWHDAWFTLGSVLRSKRVVPIATPLMNYRVHGANAAGLPGRRFSDRLAQARWPDVRTVDVWDEAVRRVRTGTLAQRLRRAVELHRRRPEHGDLDHRSGRRLVLADVLAMRYPRNGLRLEPALVDLVRRSGAGRP